MRSIALIASHTFPKRNPRPAATAKSTTATLDECEHDQNPTAHAVYLRLVAPVEVRVRSSRAVHVPHGTRLGLSPKGSLWHQNVGDTADAVRPLPLTEGRGRPRTQALRRSAARPRRWGAVLAVVRVLADATFALAADGLRLETRVTRRRRSRPPVPNSASTTSMSPRGVDVFCQLLLACTPLREFLQVGRGTPFDQQEDVVAERDAFVLRIRRGDTASLRQRRGNRRTGP